METSSRKVIFAVLAGNCLITFTMWAFCFSAGSAHARPSVSVKHSDYPVSGLTSHDLKEQMKKAGPGVESKVGGDARTKWEVTWRYGFAQVSGGCRINHVATSVHVTYIMPRWTNSGNGSPELRERWEKFLKALRKHEDGHKDHGVQAAQEIETEIAGLRPMRSCSEVERVANSTAKGIIEKYKRQDLYYDLLTLHGTTQGAVFR